MSKGLIIIVKVLISCLPLFAQTDGLEMKIVSDNTCSSLVHFKNAKIVSIETSLRESGEFYFFQAGGFAGTKRVQGTLIESGQVLQPGKSYTVIIEQGHIFVGVGYLGVTGIRRLSHVPLYQDARNFMNLEESTLADFRGGAIRINDDGSVDVGGRHKERASAEDARYIANRIKAFSPQTNVRWHENRISDLDQ